MLATIVENAPGAPTRPLLVIAARGESLASFVDGPARFWDTLLAELPAEGAVVVTADEPRIVELARAMTPHVLTFGLGAGADFRADDLHAGSHGTDFTLHTPGETRAVSLSMLGEHHVVNAVAALAAASLAGVALDDALGSLAAMPAAGPATMEALTTRDGVLVIDDGVSATTESMAAALKTLALIGTETVGAQRRRTVAVLGELDDAGENSREDHDRMGRLVVRLNVKKLVVVGQRARHIHNAAGLEGSWDGESVLVDSAEQAYDLLRDDWGTGDVVLVKSSRSAGLSALAHGLADAAIANGSAVRA